MNLENFPKVKSSFRKSNLEIRPYATILKLCLHIFRMRFEFRFDRVLKMKLSAFILPTLFAQRRNFDGNVKLTISVDGEREDIEQQEKVLKNTFFSDIYVNL